MIIYNVTIHVDDDIAADWLQWMLEVHIPDVMKTGYFQSYRMMRIIKHGEEGVNYAVQYTCESMTDLHQYQIKRAPALQAVHRARYGSKAVAFRTLMEDVTPQEVKGEE
ncbi:MAG: DUF4286 family protein [Bacteroidota bacterium]